METVTSDTMPQLFHHCKAVYDKMYKEAMVHEAYDRSQGNVQRLVYEGFFTQLFRDLQLATPYYSSVKKQLVKMGCIRQLRRGGGAAPSQWEVVREPTEGLFRDAAPKKKQGTTKLEMLQQQVRDLTAYTQSLEHRITVLEGPKDNDQGRVA